MDIASNIADVTKEIGPAVTLVAVSKTQPIESLKQAYRAGQRDFGENKVQELLSKQSEMPDDVRWHMIGHLQTNKVRQIAPFVHLIHGVDSEKLLSEINHQGEKIPRVIPCLFQLHIATEKSKFGLDEQGLNELLHKISAGAFPFVRIRGLMGMASFLDDQTQVQLEFQYLKKLYDRFAGPFDFDVLSMGMSGDFNLAVQCGSTMVRVGSRIFGNRNY